LARNPDWRGLSHTMHRTRNTTRSRSSHPPEERDSHQKGSPKNHISAVSDPPYPPRRSEPCQEGLPPLEPVPTCRLAALCHANTPDCARFGSIAGRSCRYAHAPRARRSLTLPGFASPACPMRAAVPTDQGESCRCARAWRGQDRGNPCARRMGQCARAVHCLAAAAVGCPATSAQRWRYLVTSGIRGARCGLVPSANRGICHGAGCAFVPGFFVRSFDGRRQ
jgi:hypothetical protein